MISTWTAVSRKVILKFQKYNRSREANDFLNTEEDKRSRMYQVLLRVKIFDQFNLLLTFVIHYFMNYLCLFIVLKHISCKYCKF